VALEADAAEIAHQALAPLAFTANAFDQLIIGEAFDGFASDGGHTGVFLAGIVVVPKAPSLES
jgi:hypothetical protein